jgi:2-polyprenyl-3-methyl-5-hydroxy-6-metoxy-1,4-benzoquinol methylase
VSSGGPACRLCGVPLSRVFVDLGVSPLSNAYLKEEQLHQMEPFYPLRVFVCEQCLLVQLPESQKASAIFGEEYLYFSSYSESWLRHCAAYAAMATDRFQLSADSLVVELASNDGYLLQYFKARNIPVLGIEPSANVARVAMEEKKVPTLVRFFGQELALQLRSQGRRADLIVGNNVLAHVPDLHDFIQGMKLLLHPQGTITLEFPHLLRLVKENQFDTIYHEHFSYFSLLTARRALARHELTVFDLEELPSHGGSLRLYARHAGSGPTEVSERVRAVELAERAAGFEELAGYLGFHARVAAAKRDLLGFLIAAKQEGKRVVGYGAPAKGNTLLNYCGIREDLLEFTVDRSPHKQGRFLPGTHIPILAPEALDQAGPDYVLILPWNLQREIVGQLLPLRTRGTRFVVPIPRLEILE